MFESVAPETFVPRSRKIFYESLPLSIAVHAAIAVALLVGATWRVTFPDDSPKMFAPYSLEMAPTPPPAPPAPAGQPSAPKPVVAQKVLAPEEIVAPTVIPDLVPEVQAMAAVEHSVGEGSTGAAAVEWTGGGGGMGGEAAVIGGDPDGVAGGILGGAGDGPPDTVFVKRHAQLPTAMTPMSMVYPFYPEEARVRGWEDQVVVRYTIGRDGRVKKVEVLEKPEHELFEKVAVKAIRHWRFRPLIKNGVAQEVIHELVVYFKLTT